MKLLVVVASYPPHQIGGYEIRCRDVVNKLIEKGHEVNIITTKCPEEKCKLHAHEKNIYRFLHFRSNHLLSQIIKDIRDINLLNEKVKEFTPDIIYLWSIQSLSNAILPYFSTTPFPIIHDEGSSDLVHLYKIYKRGIYFYRKDKESIIKKVIKKLANELIRIISKNLIRSNWNWPSQMKIYFNSSSSLENTKNHDFPVSNAKIIPSGIDLEHFPYNKQRKINLPVKIIIPGRVKKQKGTVEGIFLLLELKKLSIPAEIIIIGKIQSDSYFEIIKETIKINKINHLVKILPMVERSEISSYLLDSDFCFFPSYFKSGLSRVPLEAMASGCVVISYGNEGSSELIDDPRNGFIIPEGKYVAAANIIKQLVGNPTKYFEIAENARMNIELDHTFDRYVDKIEQFLLESY